MKWETSKLNTLFQLLNWANNHWTRYCKRKERNAFAFVFYKGLIVSFGYRYSVVPAQEKCSICSYPLLTRAFYVFPCHHAFHSDCLKDEVRAFMELKSSFRRYRTFFFQVCRICQRNEANASRTCSQGILRFDLILTASHFRFSAS